MRNELSTQEFNETLGTLLTLLKEGGVQCLPAVARIVRAEMLMGGLTVDQRVILSIIDPKVVGCIFDSIEWLGDENQREEEVKNTIRYIEGIL